MIKQSLPDESSKDSHTHTLPESNLKLPILAKIYDFYKILSQIIVTLPKYNRYTIGSKLDNLALEIIESILAIPFSENKLKDLQKISIKLDTLKILVRLSLDCSSITTKKYFQLEIKLSEIGKMLGGWIKSVKSSSERGYNNQTDG